MSSGCHPQLPLPEKKQRNERKRERKWRCRERETERERERGGRLSEKACIVNLHGSNMQPWRRREGDEWVMENSRQEEKRERERWRRMGSGFASLT